MGIEPEAIGTESRLAEGSVNGAVSRSSMEIAPAGQEGRQAPNPSQYASLTRTALPSIILMAPSTHASAHAPHPLHFSLSILTIFRSISGTGKASGFIAGSFP
jgi:hypothetical protein